MQTSRNGEPLSMRAPLSYTLRTGDVVSILRDPTSRPRYEWLTIATTRYAQERIKRALRRQPGWSVDSGDAGVMDEPSAETEPDQPEPLRLEPGKLMRVRLARCCYPVQGDAIAGVRCGLRMTVHRACCRTLRATAERRKADGAAGSAPEPLTWAQVPPIPFAIGLTIYGLDYSGLMFDVSEAVSGMGLNFLQGAATANQGRSKAAIAIIVESGPEYRPDEIMRRLRSLPGVTRVERDQRRGCDGGGA